MKALVPPSTLQRKKKKRNTNIFKSEMLSKPLCLPKMYGMDENSKKLVFIKERNSVYIQYLILKFVKKKT